MAYTLADLLTPQNLDEIRSVYLSALQGAGFPAITEWQPKAGVEMAYVDMIARAIDEQIAADLPDIVASGFLGHATGTFMTLLAREFYQLERIAATSTTFNLQFNSSPAAPPYNLAVGDIVVVAPSGNRYTNTTALDSQPGELSAAIAFVAEAPGADFADNPTPGAPGAVSMQMVTSFAGLSPVTAAADFAPVVQSGSSTGQIQPAKTGAATPDPHTMEIRIDLAGEIGAAQYSCSFDGGPFIPEGVLLASQELAPGTTVLALPGGTAPSFLAGDIFTVVTPGGPNFVQGSDEESNEDLAARCRARWATLSLNATKRVFFLWARLAYGSASRIDVTPDPVIAGQTNVVVADSHGPINPVSAEAIETFIAAKLSILDTVRVRPATAVNVTTTGNVKVTARKRSTVQAAAQEAWILYLGKVALGDVVRISELEQAIMDAGAVDTDTLKINGSASSLLLAAGVIPVDANPAGLISALTWMLV